jgi:hypothetical protein
MEEDRAQPSVSNVATAEIATTLEEKAREPKKRFVGRRTAERVSPKTNSNGIIEENGAVEGEIKNPKLLERYLLLSVNS